MSSLRAEARYSPKLRGLISTYTQPAEYESECHCPVCTGKEKIKLIGVSGLLEGQELAIEPKELLRKIKVDEGVKYI